mmetsp:Transcript_5148/g.6728  ORF Transcript_5148/g.6728 Transcript_5148/m.6728 type:complete len:525 (-) Transcript_5148:1898-3472(-)
MSGSNSKENEYLCSFPEILGQVEKVKSFFEHFETENKTGIENESVKNTKVKLQVLGIFRFSARVNDLDSVVKFNNNENQEHGVVDVYDLVLSDGAKKIKCLLSPVNNNNTKIKKGIVRVLDIIEISGLRLVKLANCSRKDPMKNVPILLVDEIHWVKDCPKVVCNIEDNCSWEWDKTFLLDGESCPNFRPLLFRRFAYYGISNDDCLDCTASMLMPGSSGLAQASQILCHRAIVLEKDVEITTKKIEKTGYVRRDPFWDQYSEPACEFEGLSKNHDSLKQAMDKAEKDTNKRLRKDISSLLIGKVIKKGPSTNFAKSALGSKTSLPFKFEFEIQDNTRKVKITCWNSLCRKYYNNIHVGSYVAILNWRYRPKRVRTNKDGTHVEFDAEVSMNASSTAGNHSSLWEIEEDKLHHFDNWKARFVSVKEMEDLTFVDTAGLLKIGDEKKGKESQNTNYAVLGIVIYVGRRQRIKGGDGNFYEHRWVALMDYCSESCGRKILIQVFANSQFVEYAQIKLGEAFFLGLI